MPRSPHRSLTLLVAVALVAALVVVAACGRSAPQSTSASAPPVLPAGQPPLGIGDVSWPADRAGVDSLLMRLPSTVAGWPRVQGSDALGVGTTWVGYGEGFIGFADPQATPTVATTVATAAFLKGRPPGALLMTLWGMGYGCKRGTTVGSMPVYSRRWFVDQHRLDWFGCTVNLVEGAGTLAPEQYRYLAGWAGPERVAYLVDAPSPQARDAMITALVDAAG